MDVARTMNGGRERQADANRKRFRDVRRPRAGMRDAPAFHAGPKPPSARA